MKVEKNLDHSGPGPKRRYIAAVVLKEFKGKKNVEAQLFRPVQDKTELNELLGQGYVGKPDEDMPPDLLAGATEQAALECIAESFTLEEIEDLERYLQKRYAAHMEKLVICPINLPVPLGVGPLGAIPESASSGFINFDMAPGYELDFPLRGFYDLGMN